MRINFPESETHILMFSTCTENCLEFDAVNSNPFSEYGDGRKVYADIYLDDKAWRIEDK